MLRFFRQIRQRLLTDNKFSKYLLYAVGEILLVVIGILIALQVNNWNENRRDRSLEALYVERLLEDIEEEESYVKSFIEYNTRVSSFANKAIQYFENPSVALDNPEQSLIDLYQASQFSDARTTTATYKELSSSGHLNLLQNYKLRRSIISFYELDWTKSVVVNISNKYRESLRSAIPTRIQENIRNQCGDIYVKTRTSISVEIPETCLVEIEANLAKTTLIELLKNNELREDLNFLIGNMDSKLTYMNYVHEELKELILQLKKWENNNPITVHQKDLNNS